MNLNQDLQQSLQQLLKSEMNAQFQYMRFASMSGNNFYDGMHKMFRKMSIDEGKHAHIVSDYLQSRDVFIFQDTDKLIFELKQDQSFSMEQIFQEAFQLEQSQLKLMEKIAIQANELKDPQTINFIQNQLCRQNKETAQMQTFFMKIQKFKEDKIFNYHFDNLLK